MFLGYYIPSKGQATKKAAYAALSLSGASGDRPDLQRYHGSSQ